MMKLDANKMAEQLIKLSRTVIALLESQADLNEILIVMDKRDELLENLEAANEPITNGDLVVEIVRLRNDEAAALMPYRSQLVECQQALIKLKHTKTYLSNGL